MAWRCGLGAVGLAAVMVVGCALTSLAYFLSQHPITHHPSRLAGQTVSDTVPRRLHVETLDSLVAEKRRSVELSESLNALRAKMEAERNRHESALRDTEVGQTPGHVAALGRRAGVQRPSSGAVTHPPTPTPSPRPPPSSTKCRRTLVRCRTPRSYLMSGNKLPPQRRIFVPPTRKWLL